MQDELHNDADGVSLALEVTRSLVVVCVPCCDIFCMQNWYHFQLDTLSANAVLAGRTPGSFLVSCGACVETLTLKCD
jgi:hypothetical protein